MSVKPADSWNVCLNTTLEQEDKEIYDIVENEKLRQWSGLELIASEVCKMTFDAFCVCKIQCVFYHSSINKVMCFNETDLYIYI